MNNVILTFSYSDNDKKNKPQVSKTTSVANLNIKQTACEMRNLMRLFPIMVGSFVPQSDSAWLIYLQFLQINGRLCSPKFNRGDSVFLQSLIDEFFPQFLDEFGENYDLKPKGHFLQHYPKMIEIFGPLVKTYALKQGILTLNHAWLVIKTEKTFSKLWQNNRCTCFLLIHRRAF